MCLLKLTSSVTGKTYYSKNLEPLNCTTENVIYGIECGLIYVGEMSLYIQEWMDTVWYEQSIITWNVNIKGVGLGP